MVSFSHVAWGRRKVSGQIAWHSHYPLNRVELVHNGGVPQSEMLDDADGGRGGEWEFDLQIESDGWVAERAFGEVRDSFPQPISTHTSLIYIQDAQHLAEVGGVFYACNR